MKGAQASAVADAVYARELILEHLRTYFRRGAQNDTRALQKYPIAIYQRRHRARLGITRSAIRLQDRVRARSELFAGPGVECSLVHDRLCEQRAFVAVRAGDVLYIVELT